MSSPVYDPKNREGHLMYAPKSVRDSNVQSSPGIAEGEFPQVREPSNPLEGLTAGQGDSHHSPDSANADDGQRRWSPSPPRAEDNSSEDVERSTSERELARLRRLLHPEFFDEPRQPPPSSAVASYACRPCHCGGHSGSGDFAIYHRQVSRRVE